MRRGKKKKNAAILTAASLVLRLAGMWFRIYLANALGEQGVGLYELVQAFYAVFITLATAGVSVAATRLLTEELAQGREGALGMLRLLLAAAAGSRGGMVARRCARGGCHPGGRAQPAVHGGGGRAARLLSGAAARHAQRGQPNH